MKNLKQESDVIQSAIQKDQSDNTVKTRKTLERDNTSNEKMDYDSILGLQVRNSESFGYEEKGTNLRGF